MNIKSSLHFIALLINSFIGYGLGFIFKLFINPTNEPIITFFIASIITAICMFICEIFVFPKMEARIEENALKNEIEQLERKIPLEEKLKAIRNKKDINEILLSSKLTNKKKQ